MRILFVMEFPGFLRLFDSTVRLLAERGHTVHLAFNKPYKELAGLSTLKGAEGDIRWLREIPLHDEIWQAVGTPCRIAADYVRYLSPLYADSSFSKERWRTELERPFRFLARWDTLSARRTETLMRAFGWLEAAIPSSRRLERFLKGLKPDVVVVTPFITRGSAQVDLVKSAKALGIPTCVCIASWDNLTSKGWMRVQPDSVAVWNDIQKTEATTFQQLPPERVVVTGAPVFDKWFDRRPRLTREEFCRKVLIRSDAPFILFLGSGEACSPPAQELAFVRQWLQALRSESGAEIGKASVVIRPHPFNSAHWHDVSWASDDTVRVFPPHGTYPTSQEARSDYFDTMYHAAGVVGLNTTALIDAAVLGRTVHTILAPEFTVPQTGTLHFHYLLPEHGGFLQVATGLTEHARQLEYTLRFPEERRKTVEHFVRSFVRPHGLDTPATGLLVDAIERLGQEGRRAPSRMSRRFYPLRLLLAAAGWLSIAARPNPRRRALRETFGSSSSRVKKKWFEELDLPTAVAEYHRARKRRKRGPRPESRRVA